MFTPTLRGRFSQRRRVIIIAYLAFYVFRDIYKDCIVINNFIELKRASTAE